ncbi:hypothetical protein HPB50_000630 [Hyalomma asiaticum]|uniref:Uncharacterized protein n=1 Tax=Hyalomma asiaticum TaxID=266040 RepID=A0ACB7TCE8_HYAAI|nr:hypothetical protein HPB50_000630 [Hyalomma asiaticum]
MTKVTRLEDQGEKEKTIFGTHMPVVEGEIHGRRVSVLRDSGTNTVLVRKSLVNDEELTGEYSSVLLVDSSVRWLPEAKIFVSTPYYTGSVVAKCLEEPLYDLVIGNLPGAELFLERAASVVYRGHDRCVSAWTAQNRRFPRKGASARPAQRWRQRVSTSVLHVNAPCGIRRASTAPMQRFLKRLLRRGPRKVVARARRTVRRAPSNIRGNTMREPLPLKRQPDKGARFLAPCTSARAFKAGRDEQRRRREARRQRRSARTRKPPSREGLKKGTVRSTSGASAWPSTSFFLFPAPTDPELSLRPFGGGESQRSAPNPSSARVIFDRKGEGPTRERRALAVPADAVRSPHRNVSRTEAAARLGPVCPSGFAVPTSRPLQTPLDEHATVTTMRGGAGATILLMLAIAQGSPTERSKYLPIVFPEDKPPCPAGLVCRDITLCSSAINQVRSGGRPTICGWNRHVAKVCCPQDSRVGTGRPYTPEFIAFRRPSECGILVVPQVNASATTKIPKTSTFKTSTSSGSTSRSTSSSSTRFPSTVKKSYIYTTTTLHTKADANSSRRGSVAPPLRSHTQPTLRPSANFGYNVNQRSTSAYLTTTPPYSARASPPQRQAPAAAAAVPAVSVPVVAHPAAAHPVAAEAVPAGRNPAPAPPPAPSGGGHVHYSVYQTNQVVSSHNQYEYTEFQGSSGDRNYISNGGGNHHQYWEAPPHNQQGYANGGGRASNDWYSHNTFAKRQARSIRDWGKKSHDGAYGNDVLPKKGFSTEDKKRRYDWAPKKKARNRLHNTSRECP